MKKNKFNFVIMVLCGIFFAANLSAQDLTGMRVFVDPGHDGFGANDRWVPTIPYGNQEHAGFWESRSNLCKSLALREYLQNAGAAVGLSRYTQTGVGTPHDMIGLAARVTASNTFNADFFISIHSDAATAMANHITILFRGVSTAQPDFPRNRIMAHHLFDAMIQNQVTVWGAWNVPHGIGQRNYRVQNLGVLNGLTRGGVLSEGSFHDYRPETHRLLSATYRRMEAYNIFRGISTFFAAEYGTNSELNTFTTGAIIGWVKDNTRRMSQPGIHPNASRFLPYRGEAQQNPSSTLNDVWVPINGATIELLNMAGDVLQTYTVDDYWNGIFGFFNLPVGSYQLRKSAYGFQTVIEDVVVTAGGLTNSRTFLPPDVPPLQLVLGTSANAPHTPVLPSPHTMSVGDVAFLGVQEQGSTDWLHRLDLTLTSSNENAATIAADGTVRATGIGTTDIRATRSDDGATGAITLIVTAGDLNHDHPFTSNGGLVLRATEWTSGGTAANPTLTTLPLNNGTAALIFMADAGTPANFASIAGQFANLNIQWYPQNMINNITQWGTITTAGVNTSGLVTIKFTHNDGREGLITLPVGAGLPPPPPPFELVLGTTESAPYASPLPSPFVIDTGDVVYLDIRAGGNSIFDNPADFTLTSSHPSVATISSTGVVTGVGAGTTAITVVKNPENAAGAAVRSSNNAAVLITLTVVDPPEPYRYDFYYHGSLDAPWLNQNNIRRVIHHDGKLFVLSGVPTGHAQSTAMPTIGVFDAVTLEHLFNMATPEDIIVSTGARRRINDIAMTDDGKLLAVNRAIVSSTARAVPAAVADDQNFRVYIWDNLDAVAQPRLFYTLNRNGLANTAIALNPNAAAYAAAGNVHENLSAAYRLALLNNYGIAWNWSSLLGETFTVSGTSNDATIYMPVFFVTDGSAGGPLSGDWRMAAHRVVGGELVRTHWKNFRVTHDAASTLFGFTGATHTDSGNSGLQISMSPLGTDRFIFTRNDGSSTLNFPLEFRWDWDVTTVLATNNAAPALTGSLDASHNIARSTGISFFSKEGSSHYMVVPIADAGRVNAGVTLFDITDGLDNAEKVSEILRGSISGTAAPFMKSFGVVCERGITVSLLAENQGLATFATFAPQLPPTTYTVNIQTPNNGTITVMDGNTPVSNGAVLEEGTVLTLTATPNENHRFVEWWDGNTNSTREITLNSNLTISATFEHDGTNIQIIPSESALTIFPNPVENILNINANFEITSLRLVDLTGRTIISLYGNHQSIDMSGVSAGNYILFVNDIPKRVVKR